MSESVEINEGYYGKLENIHCGVVKGFKINCGPEQLTVLNDGGEHTFEITGITAKRKAGEVSFSK
jgi:hypothetical protein